MRIPKYRRHSSGVGFVEFHKHRVYFSGEYNSPGSKAAYQQFLARNGFVDSDGPDRQYLVAHLARDYLVFAAEYYQLSNEFACIRAALKFLKPHCKMRCAKFGPLKMGEVQALLVEQDKSRQYINKVLAKIRRAFKWGAANEKIPIEVYQALAVVPGLTQGHTKAREAPKRMPVEWSVVEDTIKEASPTVRAMVLLQWYTSTRSGSVVMAKPEQFDIDAAIWRPRHKRELHTNLVLPLGPRAIEVLSPWLDRPAGAYLFSPRTARKNSRYGTHYHPHTYRQSVGRATERAFPPPESLVGELELKAWRKAHRWTPHQLRHARATMIREKYGIEAAQAALGHESLDATELYAGRRFTLAQRVARETG